MRHAGCRNENARYAKLGAVTDAMGRAGAAISEQYEIARIVTASDRDFAQQARFPPRNRAAAGANGADVDDWRIEMKPADFVGTGYERLAVDDQSHVE